MPLVSPQLICFSYHKSGTSLFFHVMTKVSARLGLRLANFYGLVEQLDPGPDIVLLPHSLLLGQLNRPYRAIRMIRDPRDIWVSDYLYHLRCDEGWCQNSDIDPTPPIGWPQVDYSVAHWPEDWKRRYLERLGGKSYQQNLLDRSRADGLAFELDGYTDCTFTTMRAWGLNRAEALDIRLEDVMRDFDGEMLRIFAHFGFTAEQSHAALEVARTEDIRRMNDAAMVQRPQIHSRTISKWREVLSPAQVALFEERHGDLILSLGYELAANGGGLNLGGAAGGERVGAEAPARSTATGSEHTAAVWLAADGVAVAPTTTGDRTYSFVVRSGVERVRLELRLDSAGSDARGGSLGVPVREIAIRCGGDEVVIAADDPRLTDGWRAVEQSGAVFWRWTDGSAEVPWEGLGEPAVVTVRCARLAEPS